MTDASAAFHPSLGQPGCDVVYHASGLLPLPSGDSESRQVDASFTVSVPPATLPHIFAHRQWRAGMVLADLVASQKHIRHLVQNKTVLELGCGTALPALAAAHPKVGQASFALATDYNEVELVGMLKHNVARNVTEHAMAQDGRPLLRAAGYTWGTSPDDIFDLLPSALLASRRSSIRPTSEATKFDTVLLADTLWDPLSHADLVKSLFLTLARTQEARVVVVAGLHTGRERIGEFVNKAVRVGLTVVDRGSSEAPGDVHLLWDELHLVSEPELEQQLELRSDEDRARDAWADGVLEFELAQEMDEDVNAALPGAASPPSSSPESTLIIHSTGPRLTGRRRRFVAHETLRPDEAKERGGVKLRNRWMTLWTLRWSAAAVQ
ncbi:hypothetical protein OC834_006804 [Tilletia horrida]|nr:hypothetical protein OC834_006804 [Tilletia horrida]